MPGPSDTPVPVERTSNGIYIVDRLILSPNGVADVSVSALSDGEVIAAFCLPSTGSAMRAGIFREVGGKPGRKLLRVDGLHTLSTSKADYLFWVKNPPMDGMLFLVRNGNTLQPIVRNINISSLGAKNLFPNGFFYPHDAFSLDERNYASSAFEDYKYSLFEKSSAPSNIQELAKMMTEIIGVPTTDIPKIGFPADVIEEFKKPSFEEKYPFLFGPVISQKTPMFQQVVAGITEGAPREVAAGPAGQDGHAGQEGDDLDFLDAVDFDGGKRS